MYGIAFRVTFAYQMRFILEKVTKIKLVYVICNVSFTFKMLLVVLPNILDNNSHSHKQLSFHLNFDNLENVMLVLPRADKHDGLYYFLKE